ncbi:MAG: hypothetical protein ACRDFS_09045 [Chloroflexota bacterium]
MPRFSTAAVQDVLPARKLRQPSQRAQIQRQYREQLRSALCEKHEALVVELEPGDKPLTIRNRLKRAADALGVTDITIRRKRNRIVAYESYDGNQQGAASG